MATQINERAPLFARPDIVAEPDPEIEGGLILRSREPLGDYPVTVVHSLHAWAAADPAHPLVAERIPDTPVGWRVVTYGQAVAAADSIGQALLDRGLGPNRPLLILSDNSVDHLLAALGAMTAGIPVAPVSVAYSLQSRDHGRIRHITEQIQPGLVFADDAARFAPALDAIGHVPAITDLAVLTTTLPGSRVAEAFGALDGDTVAKILFTSGSTGSPKGVLNTHRMLASNQQMIRQAWPFLTSERPVIVDWLPWSHTFGGNHDVNMMITNGGTLYVDAGRPVPGLFATSIVNLADVQPTIYFNVPAGYGHLVPALESDPEFAARYFARLRLIFNAAAALPAAQYERIRDIAVKTTGRAVPITQSWGATETAPAVTTANFAFTDNLCIGAPLPGQQARLKPLARTGGEATRSCAIWVKGPNVTPGYFARPALTAAAFDEQGFYATGDAVALADPGDPNAGLLFRGRTAEDFKLTTGTFVRVGALRTALLSALPVLSDMVLAGENRDCITAMAWVNPAEAGMAAAALAPAEGELIVDPELHGLIARGLAAHNATAGSAARVERMVLLAGPADLDAGEVTDKGYVNQRQVLSRRAHLLDLLYGEVPHPAVIHALPGQGHPATTPNPALGAVTPSSGHENPGSADALGE
ncbi:MAG: fadD2 [Actinomycetia bacterium]|nr:fadD2 [Actinomycetes bacterium]